MIERTTTIPQMAPIAFAVTPVFFVLVSVAVFALSGLALLKLRTSMAASRPVDVEAAVSQIQGFDGHQMALRDALGRLIRVRAGVDPNAGSEAMLLARPESIFVQESLKTIQQSEPGLVPSSSFEAWTSSLCDLIEDFAGVERTPKTHYQLSLVSGLVASTSFELWAATLCDLISDLASPAPFRSGFTPLIDNFEDDPYDTNPKPTIIIPDIMVTPPSPRLEEDIDQSLFAPGLTTSPSFLDLTAESIEELGGDDTEAVAAIEDDDNEPIILTGELLDQFPEPPKEPVLSLSFRYESTLSNDAEAPAVIEDNDSTPVTLALVEPLDQFPIPPTEPVLSSFSRGPTLSARMPAIISGSNGEEHTRDHTTEIEHSHSYLSSLSVISLSPVADEPVWEKYEPEGELRSVIKPDSEDDETYYSRCPHPSRPRVPPASQSMTSLLRNIVEKRKVQKSSRKESKSDKENPKEHSHTSKRGFFSKTLAAPSAPQSPIRVPTIKLMPPTPPRRVPNRENEDVGMDSEMEMETDEGLEGVAFGY